MTNDKMVQTAHHVAGHALAFVEMKVEFYYATIVPDRKKWGHFKLDDEENDWRERAIALWAGPLAEAEFSERTGVVVDLGSDSIREIWDSKLFDGDHRDFGFIEMYAGWEVDPKHLALYRRLSGSPKELPPKELKKKRNQLIRECAGEARKMIDQNWSEIEAIAEALLARKTLLPSEVRAIMRTARKKQGPARDQEGRVVGPGRAESPASPREMATC
jgi:hypothetical protein